MNLLVLAWALWIVGTVLVILSWVEVVSIQTGWAGFAIGTVGFLLGRIPMQRAGTDESLPPSVPAGQERMRRNSSLVDRN
jgi:hypothetical protein